MKDYQARRIEAVAYGRALRVPNKEQSGAMCMVYHTLRLRYTNKYKSRGNSVLSAK